jgi:hypothetical protein
MPTLARGEVAADRVSGGSGEGCGAAEALQALLVVVSAEQPTVWRSGGAGDCVGDRLGHLAHPVLQPAAHPCLVR